MEEIIKLTQSSPVSFDKGFIGLTYGQRVLLEMLTRHLSEQKAITRENIEDCWIKAVAPTDGNKKMWIYTDNGYEHKLVHLKSHYDTQSRALQWFKLNIGSVILKGKLLVIPVIEIEETKNLP